MKKLIFLFVCVFGGISTSFSLPVVTLPGSGLSCTGPGCGSSYPNGGDVNKYCEDHSLSAGQPCVSTGATRAVCVDNHSDVDGDDHVSCAARECNPGWLLWFHKKGSEYVPYGLCREKSWLQTNYCDVGCDCPDPENYKCVVIERDVPAKYASGRGGKVFFDQDLCGCQKKTCAEKYPSNADARKCCELAERGVKVQWNKTTNKCECTEPGKVLEGEQCIDKPVVSECDKITDPAERDCCKLRVEQKKPVHWDKDNKICKCDDPELDLKDGNCVEKGEEGDCRYTFRGFVTCNGKKVFKFTSFKVSKKMAQSLKLPTCKPGETVTIPEQYKQDKAEFEKLRDEICGKPQDIFDITYDDNGGNTDNEFIDAKNRIDAFIRNANLNVSVWKNADGKFNTSRLASDLTAGVVLGTVGGIVSANVIKKKQLEKGYDALHCAIGGQKVADWGDQFTVGFRQY